MTLSPKHSGFSANFSVAPSSTMLLSPRMISPNNSCPLFDGCSGLMRVLMRAANLALQHLGIHVATGAFDAHHQCANELCHPEARQRQRFGAVAWLSIGKHT